jgi:deazaflavin-dependent oxidoreductase (nitroreductase family)
MPSETLVPAHRVAATPFERVFNRSVGLLARLGLTRSDYVRLEVVGRKSGATHATPVNLLAHEGHRYLVAPRGETQWVRNARAAGRVTLVHGRARESVALRALPVRERAPVLRAYLTRYAFTVQRFFSVRPSDAPSAFEAIASRHPVFELT